MSFDRFQEMDILNHTPNFTELLKVVVIRGIMTNSLCYIFIIESGILVHK